MSLRVAVASSDGINIDQHFGHAQSFRVYDLTAVGNEFIEERSILRGSGHDIADFDRVASLLQDCSAVIVARIGPRAAGHLLNAGLRVMEAPYPIDAVLKKLRDQTFNPRQNP